MAGFCFLCANWYRIGINADAEVQEKELSDLKPDNIVLILSHKSGHKEFWHTLFSQ